MSGRLARLRLVTRSEVQQQQQQRLQCLPRSAVILTCLFVYEIPISRHSAHSRFFMTFSPRSSAQQKKLEKLPRLTWTKAQGWQKVYFSIIQRTCRQPAARRTRNAENFLSRMGPVQNGETDGDGECSYVLEQGRLSGLDLPARVDNRLPDALGGMIGKTRSLTAIAGARLAHSWRASSQRAPDPPATPQTLLGPGSPCVRPQCSTETVTR